MDEASLSKFAQDIMQRNQHYQTTHLGNPIKNETQQSLLNQQENSKLFILVSFSMPDKLLLDYIRQANEHHAWVVFQGFKDNDLSLFLQTLSEWDKKIDINRVLIDPTLFTRYHVSQVPTFILAHDIYPCDREHCESNSFNKLSGSVTLDYALQTMKGAS